MKNDVVVYAWVGRDGNNWRELLSGGRFVYFLQREISAGIWG